MRQQHAPVVERAIHVFVMQHAEAGLLAGHLLGNADAFGTLPMRHDVDDRHPNEDREAGHGAANASMIWVRNRMRFSSDPPYLPGPRLRAQHLVAEIAMARLRVDELKAAVMREPRRGDVVVHEAIELVVGQHAHAAREPLIENRMMARRERRRLVPHVGPREASRVGNLQPEIQIGVGVRAEALAMRRQ